MNSNKIVCKKMYFILVSSIYMLGGIGLTILSIIKIE